MRTLDVGHEKEKKHVLGGDCVEASTSAGRVPAAEAAGEKLAAADVEPRSGNKAAEEEDENKPEGEAATETEGEAEKDPEAGSDDGIPGRPRKGEEALAVATSPSSISE